MPKAIANKHHGGGAWPGSGMAIADLDGVTDHREPISDPLPCCCASAVPGPYVAPRGAVDKGIEGGSGKSGGWFLNPP